MTGYNKGMQSREWIINHSREIFNELGLGITLNKLAKELNVTLGMLTYHFATKDSLFVAIAQDYQLKLNMVRIHNPEPQLSLSSLYELAGRVMDLQYGFRCVMRYIASSSYKQTEIFDHQTAQFIQIKSRLLYLTTKLVESGELHKSILEGNNYRVYLFVFTNLFTNWAISLETYDYPETYESLKPIYLKGIFLAYLPYLTERGKEALKRVNVEY